MKYSRDGENIFARNDWPTTIAGTCRWQCLDVTRDEMTKRTAKIEEKREKDPSREVGRERRRRRKIDEKKISRERILGARTTDPVIVACCPNPDDILRLSLAVFALTSAIPISLRPRSALLAHASERKTHTDTHEASSSWFSRCFRAIFANSSRGKGVSMRPGCK